MQLMTIGKNAEKATSASVAFSPMPSRISTIGRKSAMRSAAKSFSKRALLILTGGERNDITQAVPLMEKAPATRLIADKGYDSLLFIEAMKEKGITCVIPPRIHLRDQRRYSKELYKQRNKIERFFSKLKHFKRIAMRAEKLAGNFMGMLQLACAIISSR